jgi:indolepyruvate ferredoxin oxidoreductase
VAVIDTYRLSDRYTEDDGRVFVTGVQALARLPVEQLRADRRHGLTTAAFVSGYPGSPLAGYDKEIDAAIRAAADLPLVHNPGLNEELAATSVMGSQLANEVGPARYDGVVGIWYGKAPGLDRACDAIRHANFAGTSRTGGVVALVGDDPGAKSSTLPSTSGATLLDLHIPILFPGDVQEAIDLGRHAIYLSRACGLWTSIKIVAAVADGTGSIELHPDRFQYVIPEFEVDGQPFVHHPSGRLLTPYTLELEKEFVEVRLELAMRYGVQNHLNTIAVNPPGRDAWIGIAASGHTFHETREALRVLGLRSNEDLRDAGIRLLNLRMPVTVDPALIRRFADGLDEVLVIEEKNPNIELIVKDACYSLAERPTVVGKRDELGNRLVASTGALDVDLITGPLRARLAPRLGERLTREPKPRRELIPLSVNRTPYFCSGCPHNWGTKVPEGQLVGAGIGCHTMTMLMEPERVGDAVYVSAMGGEGAAWIGMAPFIERDHLVQNVGDGTFFHSAELAVRAAIAAGVNITYKLLYNGTIAMTGGQDPAGVIKIPELTQIFLLQGVRQVLITTDDVSRYDDIRLPAGVEVWDRHRIVEAQELLATVPGVTVLIHDQACAAENRRARKRGLAPTPTARVVINERVCEGCGDCGDVSNCLSVQPVETPFGRKTRIHQTSCNLDYTCLDGDCPSFMTVEPADPSAKRARPVPSFTAELPEPERVVDTASFTLRMPGIGGTGVVSVSQIVGTAALLDGLHVRGLDQTGLSQKAGPVVSDLRIDADQPRAGNKASAASVDLYLAFDLLVSLNPTLLAGADPDRTVVIASTTGTATGAMVVHPDMAYPDVAGMRATLDAVSRPEHNRWVDAGAVTAGLFGDATTANVFLLGVAYQAGALPVSAASLDSAIELNGVAVDRNRAAFSAGRHWAVDPVGVEAAAGIEDGAWEPVAPVTLNGRLASRVEALGARTGLGETLRLLTSELVAYQSEGLAGEYLDVVERVAGVEAGLEDGFAFTEAVARNLYKLTAYKDEYEVARLLLLPNARRAAEAVAGPGAKITYKLHPPMLKALGLKRKIGLGEVTEPGLRALAAGRRLRGTWADPFGRTEMRRLERRLVAEYRAAVERMVPHLSAMTRPELVAIAELPQQVRGYEELKIRRARAYQAELSSRLGALT